MAPHVDAIDLNCGCPQRWAMQEGYGSHLISHPQLISDMVFRDSSCSLYNVVLGEGDKESHRYPSVGEDTHPR